MWRYAREEPFFFFFGLLIVAASVYGLIYWGSDILAYGSRPRPLGVDAAVAAAARHRQWVAVDAAWDCRQQLEEGAHTWLPARTSDGQQVVAHFEKPIDCAAISGAPVDGILEPMSAADVTRLRASGFSRDDARVWELAVVDFHPRNNALIAVVIFVVLVVVGLWFVPIIVAIGEARTRWYEWNRSLTRTARSTHPRRNYARWKLACICFASGGTCLLFPDWVVWQVVPVPWVGFVGIAVGLFWVSFALTDR